MKLTNPIAILGATSQLAKDYIKHAHTFFSHDFILYARALDKVSMFQEKHQLRYPALYLDKFGQEKYSAIINFIGIGDPAKAKIMGADIFDATLHTDLKVLQYLKINPETIYIFISSGAVYGTDYLTPVTENSYASIPINNLSSQNYYSIAKLYAEARHRALPDYTIFDIRIFNYISRSLDLNSRFFITDIINAIRNKQVFETDDQAILRDFMHPTDFCRLVQSCLNSKARLNMALDAYSKSPIDKTTLLNVLREKFGLNYKIVRNAELVNATGRKPYYYSKMRSADKIGYMPAYDSLSAILEEIQAILVD